MRKILIVLAAVLAFSAVFAGCSKEETFAPTEYVDENVTVIEPTNQRLVTDREEIEELVIEYGIPIEAESINGIVETEIDASVFDS